MWGESSESVREWLLQHEADIPEHLVGEMVRHCQRERSRSLRRSGFRDCLIGTPLLLGGGTAFVLLVLSIDAGAGTVAFICTVGSTVPAVVGLLLLLRGVERLAFGARAEGEARDTVFWD
jgi:hypothetical protein